MKIKSRIAAIGAAITVALTSILVVASPASAATSCSYSYKSGGTLGSGSGYYFTCNGNTTGTLHLTITCVAIYVPTWHTVQKDVPIVYNTIWSVGRSLRCSSSYYATNPNWWWQS